MNLDKVFYEECACEADKLVDWREAMKRGRVPENHPSIVVLKQVLHSYGLQVAQITAKRMVELAQKEMGGRSKGG